MANRGTESGPASGTGESDASSEKLTIAERLLAAMPNLRRSADAADGTTSVPDQGLMEGGQAESQEVSPSELAGTSHPKLTLGQRLLVSLPSIKRPASSPGAPDRDPGKTPATKTSTQPVEGASEKEPDKEVAGASSESANAAADGESGDEEGPKTYRNRLRDTVLKPPTERPTPQSSTAKYEAMDDAELLVLHKKVDDRERLVGFFGAPLGAALGIIATVYFVRSDPPLHHKGHFDSGTVIEFGVVEVILPILILVAAFVRRRSFLAFAAIFTGISLVGEVGWILALPFVLGGAWLLLHGYRISKVLAARGIGPGARYAAQRSKDPKGRARPAARGRGKAVSEPEPTVRPRPSTANKRYTPPKPPAKKPVPAKPQKDS